MWLDNTVPCDQHVWQLPVTCISMWSCIHQSYSTLKTCICWWIIRVNKKKHIHLQPDTCKYHISMKAERMTQLEPGCKELVGWLCIYIYYGLFITLFTWYRTLFSSLFPLVQHLFFFVWYSWHQRKLRINRKHWWKSCKRLMWTMVKFVLKLKMKLRVIRNNMEEEREAARVLAGNTKEKVPSQAQ